MHRHARARRHSPTHAHTSPLRSLSSVQHPTTQAPLLCDNSIALGASFRVPPFPSRRIACAIGTACALCFLAPGTSRGQFCCSHVLSVHLAIATSLKQVTTRAAMLAKPRLCKATVTTATATPHVTPPPMCNTCPSQHPQVHSHAPRVTTAQTQSPRSSAPAPRRKSHHYRCWPQACSHRMRSPRWPLPTTPLHRTAHHRHSQLPHRLLHQTAHHHPQPRPLKRRTNHHRHLQPHCSLPQTDPRCWWEWTRPLPQTDPHLSQLPRSPHPASLLRTKSHR